MRKRVGKIGESFAEIDWQPLGSASIAQAHGARLTDGRQVVVKVRRPGLEDQVERDLAITRWLARTAERRTTWGAFYQVTGLVHESAAALHGELDFHVEARHAVEAAAAMERHPRIVAPEIIDSLTSERMLVMVRLSGVPLSATTTRMDGERGRLLADALCVSQVAAMLKGEEVPRRPSSGERAGSRRRHARAHRLRDRRASRQFRKGVGVPVLVAIKLEQPSLLYEAMVSIGAISPTRDPDEIERALAQFLAADVSSGLPSPEALTDLLALTHKLRMRLPRSTTTMFRALATLAGTLEQLSAGYPLIDVIADLGGVEFRERMLPCPSPSWFNRSGPNSARF